MTKRTDKINIEQLFRIKLAHLKPLMYAAKELRRLPPPERKGKTIGWGIEYSRGEYVRLHFKLTYHFKTRTHLGTGEELVEDAILFEYTTPDGELKKQDIDIVSRESNLGRGYSEYYFMDSSYNLCRTLYSDRWGIYSRQQLTGRVRYEKQGNSRKLRKLNRHLRADKILCSINGRHLLYKNRLTPIGKQAIKAKELRMEEPDIINTIWEDGRRNRKKKPEIQRRNINIF